MYMVLDKEAEVLIKQSCKNLIFAYVKSMGHFADHLSDDMSTVFIHCRTPHSQAGETLSNQFNHKLTYTEKRHTADLINGSKTDAV